MFNNLNYWFRWYTSSPQFEKDWNFGYLIFNMLRLIISGKLFHNVRLRRWRCPSYLLLLKILVRHTYFIAKLKFDFQSLTDKSHNSSHLLQTLPWKISLTTFSHCNEKISHHIINYHRLGDYCYYDYVNSSNSPIGFGKCYVSPWHSACNSLQPIPFPGRPADVGHVPG